MDGQGVKKQPAFQMVRFYRMMELRALVVEAVGLLKPYNPEVAEKLDKAMFNLERP